MWRHVVVKSRRRSAAALLQRTSMESRSISSSSSPFDDSTFAMSSLNPIPSPIDETVMMKSLVNTLSVAQQRDAYPRIMMASSVVEATLLAEESPEEEEQVDPHEDATEEEVSSSASLDNESSEEITHEGDEEPSHTTSTDGSSVGSNNNNNQNKTETPLIAQKFYEALRNKQANKATRLLAQCQQVGVCLNPSRLLELFYLTKAQDPVTSHQALVEYRKAKNDTPAPVIFYQQMCNSLGIVRWHVARLQEYRDMVRHFYHELKELPPEYQSRCFPAFLTGLIQQPRPVVGRMANGVYQYMLQNKLEMSNEQTCHLLAVSRFTRQDDLDFVQLFSQVVESGYRPQPPIAMHVLQNLFPFATRMEQTICVIKALIKLQTSWQPGNVYPEYRVDVGTLENVMAAAARPGSTELVLLVWDLVDALGISPTETMYDCTIHTFAMGNGRTDHNMFSVLREMEDSGYTPSRALIRSLSRSLRFSTRRLDGAYEIAMDPEEKASLACLNVILSTAAERADVDRAFMAFDDFEKHGIAPNSDSYSFLLEAICRSVGPKVPDDQRMRDGPGRLDAAFCILSLMEEQGVPICHNCVEQYSQLLCNVDKLEEATSFCLSLLEDEKGAVVSNRTLIIMALKNAQAGNFDTARQLASKTTEPFGFLERKIQFAADKQNDDGAGKAVAATDSAAEQAQDTPKS